MNRPLVQKVTFAMFKNRGYRDLATVYFFNQTVAYSPVTIDTFMATFKYVAISHEKP